MVSGREVQEHLALWSSDWIGESSVYDVGFGFYHTRVSGGHWNTAKEGYDGLL